MERVCAQSYTHADTLRGSNTRMRSCYDVVFYHLTLRADPASRTISGNNLIRYKITAAPDTMQIDLYKNLIIDSILADHHALPFRRSGNATFVWFAGTGKPGSLQEMTVYYHGKPTVAANAPWDGGFVWQTDVNKHHWIGVACEGVGASIWWPCKDYLGDEPDSMRLTYETPSDLVCAANGQLRNTVEEHNGWTRTEWVISYPINTYDVTLNAADYVHWHETYLGKNDSVPLDFYVLRNEVDQARSQFEQVKPMLACYEAAFGSFPFPRDGYKLVESFYWGMEHQSAVAYGNGYQNNRWGFDFIIIHESAHEWWGNNVSMKDAADMWLHESFATYAETWYMECMQGREKAQQYLESQRYLIQNKHPVQGVYGVNYETPDNDQYYKGAWMIHTFRSVVGDTLFFAWLKGLQQRFRLQTISYSDFILFTDSFCNRKYDYFFEQYLMKPNLPVFEYKLKGHGRMRTLSYRWTGTDAGFSMPVVITNGTQVLTMKKSEDQRWELPATVEWKSLKIEKKKTNDLEVDTHHFYVKVQQDR